MFYNCQIQVCIILVTAVYVIYITSFCYIEYTRCGCSVVIVRLYTFSDLLKISQMQQLPIELCVATNHVIRMSELLCLVAHSSLLLLLIRQQERLKENGGQD